MRNLSLLEKSFFRERFNTKYVDMIEKCGVRLAVTHTMIKYLGFMLSNPSIVSLDPSKPPQKKCAWKGEIPGLKGQIVNICRRTEELQVVRELDYGIQQFVSQIVNEPPPYHQSLWLSSDGYFYTLSLAPADISHKNFKSGSWILKA